MTVHTSPQLIRKKIQPGPDPASSSHNFASCRSIIIPEKINYAL
jgi:hypothetical protein